MKVEICPADCSGNVEESLELGLFELLQWFVYKIKDKQL